MVLQYSIACYKMGRSTFFFDTRGLSPCDTKGKKKQAQEHGPEDCLAVNEEHVEGGAEDENGQPSS